MATANNESYLQDAIAQIWYFAENADGSRSGMQTALDQVQEICFDAVPDVEERADEFEEIYEDLNDEDTDNDEDLNPIRQSNGRKK